MPKQVGGSSVPSDGKSVKFKPSHLPKTLISGHNSGKLQKHEVAPIAAARGEGVYYLQVRSEKRNSTEKDDDGGRTLVVFDPLLMALEYSRTTLCCVRCGKTIQNGLFVKHILWSKSLQEQKHYCPF